LPLTKTEERIFEKLRRKKYREYMAKRRDKICHKCKTTLNEKDKICPKCGTKKRKYAPRTTRKDKEEKI